MDRRRRRRHRGSCCGRGSATGSSRSAARRRRPANIGVPVSAGEDHAVHGDGRLGRALRVHPGAVGRHANVLRGTGNEFEAIITAVIGGTLLTGGYGSALGSAFGALHPRRDPARHLLRRASTPTGTRRPRAAPPDRRAGEQRTPAPRLGSPMMTTATAPRHAVTLPSRQPSDRAYGTPAGGPAATSPVLEARDISKSFGRVIALEDVSLTVRPARSTACSATTAPGKSTLIKTLSGVHPPDEGELLDGRRARHALSSPRDALDRGIATVYQDLAVLPLMSISRNFFLGNEPTKGVGPLRRFDVGKADRIAREHMHEIGIDVRDTAQLVGHPVRRRAPDAGHRPGRVLRRAGADPRRADLGARRQAGGDRPAPRHPRPARRASASSSSPTTSSTRCRSATSSRS